MRAQRMAPEQPAQSCRATPDPEALRGAEVFQPDGSLIPRTAAVVDPLSGLLSLSSPWHLVSGEH